ncbi:sce7726 family protein [Bacillus velezensis]|uniref:sce7726 family protein n=1 Tax=Bacillus TaxID=1386 RepID=UPI00111EACC2|nr:MULTISPECIES: sce7726 family protein [Bacillus amyloliquefaciens group]NMV99367.1 sce7726 family protein [Bacillus velezensis]NRR84383.1 sce7726 family protein [Bacillus velezensis]NRS08945.1 sce7726 family protein [Bacillus velezensis]TNU31221.1 sce7726 family protein [Bacillus velezensis]TNU62454.1 sce7726 family protein [Bacillus velezensis]
MKKLDDKEIRSTLISRLTTYKDCRVFEEVTVPSGKARADIVAVNGHVVAYEIKSDFDSIKRLTTQIPEYDKNFEMNYVVVGQKFAESITMFVPEHWGIIVAEKTRVNTVRLSFIKKARLNPNLSFKDFISLLSSEDVKKIALMDDYLGKKLPKRKIRELFKQEVIKRLDETVPNSLKNKLKNRVRFLLKNV